jgi:hypothetical protein
MLNRGATLAWPGCHGQAWLVRALPASLAALIPMMITGCNAKRVTVADTFPPGSYASPWVLQGEVWSGTLDQAADGLGEEAEEWQAFGPGQVWLAVYAHDTRPGCRLIARAFAFSSVEQARQAFAHFRPPNADKLEAGDEACWTDDGVLVLWGRLVYDIFGNDPTSFAGAEQALYLLACIEKKMAPDLPSAPR